MPIEEKTKLSNQFFESELSPQNKADIYKFLSDMKHISQFSLDWQKASKKQIF
jgi:hypothetical protein